MRNIEIKLSREDAIDLLKRVDDFRLYNGPDPCYSKENEPLERLRNLIMKELVNVARDQDKSDSVL